MSWGVSQDSHHPHPLCQRVTLGQSSDPVPLSRSLPRPSASSPWFSRARSTLTLSPWSCFSLCRLTPPTRSLSEHPPVSSFQSARALGPRCLVVPVPRRDSCWLQFSPVRWSFAHPGRYFPVLLLKATTENGLSGASTRPEETIRLRRPNSFHHSFPNCT